MDIQSVRALKQEIAVEVVPHAVSAIQRSGGFAITTFALDNVTKAEPLVALGVAPGKSGNDVRLAVRLQRRSFKHSKSFVETISERAKGEVEVRFVGRITKHALPWYRERVRPLRPGASVGHYLITAGTIGAIATEKKSKRPVILSNNHVLANENNAKAGDPILQAGRYDGGKRPKDVIAELTNWVKLVANRPNLLDAAIATIEKSVAIEPSEYRGIGTLNGAHSEDLVPGIDIAKIGRTTGLTHGRISAVEVDNVVIGYDMGQISFNNQVEIESTEGRSFSAGGDSGSLILDKQNRACALLFAGSESGGPNGRGLTYANPIGVVLQRLAIELPGD